MVRRITVNFAKRPEPLRKTKVLMQKYALFSGHRAQLTLISNHAGSER
jgi:hypothetical protein